MLGRIGRPFRRSNHPREAIMLEEMLQKGEAELERIQRLRGYL
jgi:hypothetical protein